MALALTTTSSAPAVTVATAVALNSTVASSLLVAPTSSISLTPGPSSDPVVSNDSPADDPAPLGADASAVSAASSSTSASAVSGSSLATPSTPTGPSRSPVSAPSPSSPSQQSGQKIAAQSSSISEQGPKDLLPSSTPDDGQCFGAAGTGTITTACCASLKGALASGAQYCLFEAKNAQTWENCVNTATDGNKAQLAVKCSGSRRHRAAWAVIALGVGVALMGSA